jgi:hypothetical protein
MKKMTISVVALGLLLALAQVHAGKPGGKPPKDDGGDKGGFGELGNGCVTFVQGPDGSFPTPGTGRIHDDSELSLSRRYCNGTDGQVSIPVRLRVDTKKFNKENRYYSFEYDDCNAADWCDGGAKLAHGQMGNEYVWAEDPDDSNNEILVLWEGGLDMTLMPADPDYPAFGSNLNVTRVGMGFFIDNDHQLSFSNEYNDRGCFGESSDAEPLWVRCDADVGGGVEGGADGLCDRWTVSTFPLSPDGGFAEGPPVNACLKNGIFVMEDPNVRADFTIEVCVMGTGEDCQPYP